MPCLLLHAGHFVTVEELWEAAGLIIDHTAGVVPGASQRTQKELSLFGITSQLREYTEAVHMQQYDGGYRI